MVGVLATALHYGIYFLLQRFINVNIAYTLLCPELYRQFLPYRIFHVRQKAVMEQGVRFWRSTFIQLPAAHRFAEYIPLVGTLQNPCPYSGIRHSHSGQFPVGTLRFQTKRLIFLKSIIFNYNIYPGLLRKIIYLQSIYHTHLRNEESNPTDSGLQRRSDAPYPISALDRTYQPQRHLCMGNPIYQ